MVDEVGQTEDKDAERSFYCTLEGAWKQTDGIQDWKARER